MYGPACEPETSYQLLFNMECQGKHKCNRKKSVINLCYAFTFKKYT